MSKGIKVIIEKDLNSLVDGVVKLCVFRAFLLILMMMLATSCKTRQELVDANQSRAESVIGAIYKYKIDFGFFPKALSDLTPLYLKNIPTTISEDKFFYSVDNLNGFTLSFTIRLSERDGFGCGFTDKTRSWECGYGD